MKSTIPAEIRIDHFSWLCCPWSWLYRTLENFPKWKRWQFVTSLQKAGSPVSLHELEIAALVAVAAHGHRSVSHSPLPVLSRTTERGSAQSHPKSPVLCMRTRCSASYGCCENVVFWFRDINPRCGFSDSLPQTWGACVSICPIIWDLHIFLEVGIKISS